MNRYERGVLEAARAFYAAKRCHKAVSEDLANRERQLSLDEQNTISSRASMEIWRTEGDFDAAMESLIRYEQRGGRRC